MSSSSRTEATIKVRLKYLSALRDRTGNRWDDVGFPAGATLQDVVAWLKTRYGLTLPDPHVMATLNGRGWEQLPARLSTEIAEGDVICLFPPISGG